MASEFETSETAALAAELRELEGLADSFGGAMTSAFRRSVVDGERLEDVLRSIALSLSSRALNQALAPIGQGIGGWLSGALGGIFGGAALRQGGAGEAAGVGDATALRGPSQAAGARASVSVVFNVTTPDAASFRRAEADLGAMLARAVARGQRGM